MEREEVTRNLNAARQEVQGIVQDTSNGERFLHRASEEDPELRQKLEPLIQQLRAVGDLARDIEREVVQHYRMAVDHSN